MEKVIFSPEDINQVESLAAGMSVEQAAHYFGIGLFLALAIADTGTQD